MTFYLGTTAASWLTKLDVPLFLSRRAMPKKRLRPAVTDWVLDSGGYSELSRDGSWGVSVAEYASEIARFVEHVGRLVWVAPMDWMCEPNVLARTGLTVSDHQRLTVESFLRLRDRVGPIVAPVLQGWTRSDYARCVDLYDEAAVDLGAEPVVGVGSICRRGQDAEIGRILRGLAHFGFALHAFGVRGRALVAHAEVLASADSMAWSYRARAARQPGPNAGYEKTGMWCCGEGTNCSGCFRYALRWRHRLLSQLHQLQMEV